MIILFGCNDSKNKDATPTTEVTTPTLTTKVGCPTELTLPDSLIASTVCEYYTVPLRRDRSDSPNIEVMTMKFPATGSPVLGDLWILDGGPGSTGLAQAVPDVVNPPEQQDIMFISLNTEVLVIQRRSTALRCIWISQRLPSAVLS